MYCSTNYWQSRARLWLVLHIIEPVLFRSLRCRLSRFLVDLSGLRFTNEENNSRLKFDSVLNESRSDTNDDYGKIERYLGYLWRLLFHMSSILISTSSLLPFSTSQYRQWTLWRHINYSRKAPLFWNWLPTRRMMIFDGTHSRRERESVWNNSRWLLSLSGI